MKSRDRSIVEVILAVTCVGFLTGFVAVLCIGNYFRAIRAMERQQKRRLENLSGGGRDGSESGPTDSPRSAYSTSSSFYGSEGGEQQHLMPGRGRPQESLRVGFMHNGRYRIPQDSAPSASLLVDRRIGSFPSQQYRRRKTPRQPHYSNGEADLLLVDEEIFQEKGSDVMSV